MKQQQEELGKEAFSSIDFVGQCAVDEVRTIAFKKAIGFVVKKDLNQTVVDLGTGSGIMAIFAAKAGAKKVFGIEYDPFIAKIARRNVLENEVDVGVVIEDAKNLNLDLEKPIDVVVSEMLTTGVVDEIQVQAINNLHKKGLVNEKTIFIPIRHDTFVKLVDAKTSFFDVKLQMIIHLWRWHKKLASFKRKSLSDNILLNSLDFTKVNEENFSTVLDIKIKKTGTVNGIILSSETILTKKISVGDTEALNAPVFVPVEEVQVTKGDRVKLAVSYVFGGGFETLKAEVLK